MKKTALKSSNRQYDVFRPHLCSPTMVLLCRRDSNGHRELRLANPWCDLDFEHIWFPLSWKHSNRSAVAAIKLYQVRSPAGTITLKRTIQSQGPDYYNLSFTMAIRVLLPAPQVQLLANKDEGGTHMLCPRRWRTTCQDRGGTMQPSRLSLASLDCSMMHHTG